MWMFTHPRENTESPTRTSSTLPNMPMAIDDQADGTRLYLGPSRSAELLEVVTIVRDDGSELAIHAMPMRPKYQRLLPEG
jgi:hypothetical protein